MQSPGSGRDHLAQDLDGLRNALGQASSWLDRVQSSLVAESAARPPVVPVRTVARWLGMTERGVRKLIERGEIPAVQLGKRLYVFVDDWIAKMRADAAERGFAIVRES